MNEDVLAPLIAENSSAAHIDAVITEVRRLRDEASQWRSCCLDHKNTAEIWCNVAREVNIPKWNGMKYSETKEWALRTFEAVESLRTIASELAEKHVRGKGACTACGAAGYMGTMAHNDGCPVSRLAAITS